ncbi:hypothetical protein PY365_07655 [Roseiarcaceae bacterium H3SJ34-1]|uniref:hypothetical protein n=1 Tax=Terripilifer ovatus TaxID=3032367 RepID=UPI003AB9ABC3|nr:hypothetical protein [Roseiarcaceae bacterium H3SJ34-1]
MQSVARMSADRFGRLISVRSFSLCAFALLSTLPVAAQQAGGSAQQSDNPFATILRGPRFTTTPMEPQDWVKRSRPADNQAYIPVGRNADQPQRRVMTPDEVRAKEAELDAVRAKHDRLAHRKPLNVRIGSATAPPLPKKESKKPTCVLTCDTGLGTTTRK